MGCRIPKRVASCLGFRAYRGLLTADDNVVSALIEDCVSGSRAHDEVMAGPGVEIDLRDAPKDGVRREVAYVVIRECARRTAI